MLIVDQNYTVGGKFHRIILLATHANHPTEAISCCHRPRESARAQLLLATVVVAIYIVASCPRPRLDHSALVVYSKSEVVRGVPAFHLGNHYTEILQGAWVVGREHELDIHSVIGSLTRRWRRERARPHSSQPRSNCERASNENNINAFKCLQNQWKAGVSA